MRRSREINRRKMLTNQPHTITLSPHSLLAAPRCRILRGWLWICHPHTKTQGRQLSAQAVAVAPVWVTGASLHRRLDASIRLKQMWPFINMRSISVYPQQDGFDIILLYLTLSLLLCCCRSLSSLSLPLSPSHSLFLPPLCHAEWASWNFIKHNMCRRAKFMSHICFNHNPFGGTFKCNLDYCTDLRAVSLGVYGSFPQG